MSDDEIFDPDKALDVVVQSGFECPTCGMKLAMKNTGLIKATMRTKCRCGISYEIIDEVKVWSNE